MPVQRGVDCAPQTVIEVLACILTEAQVLFHSSQTSLLVLVQECVLSLAFPFTWEHAYIPVLPKVAVALHGLTGPHGLRCVCVCVRARATLQELINVLQAPVPYIVGMHSDNLPPPSALDHLLSSEVGRWS